MTKECYLIFSAQIVDGKKCEYIAGGLKNKPSARYGGWNAYKTKEEALNEVNYLAEVFGGTYRVVKKIIETEEVAVVEKKYHICEFCALSEIESIDALTGKKFYSCKKGCTCEKVNRISPCGYFEEKQ